MTYAMAVLLMIILIGMGITNYKGTCKKAKRLIDLYGDQSSNRSA